MIETTTVSVQRVFAGKLHRVRRGNRKQFWGAPAPEPPSPVCRPARIAIMLALARKIQDAIDRGTVRDRAEVAKRLGLTRARVTQLLDLTLLAPDIQGALLDLEAIDGIEPVSERDLRGLTRIRPWEAQHRLWIVLDRVAAPSSGHGCN